MTHGGYYYMKLRVSGVIPPTSLIVALRTFLAYPPALDLLTQSSHLFEGGTRY